MKKPVDQKEAQRLLREAQATFDSVKKAQHIWNDAAQEWSRFTEAVAMSSGEIEEAQLASLLARFERIIAHLTSLASQEELAIRNLGVARKALADLFKRDEQGP